MIANPQTGTMESISSGQFAIERKMRTAKEILSDIIRQGKARELGPVAVWEQVVADVREFMHHAVW